MLSSLCGVNEYSIGKGFTGRKDPKCPSPHGVYVNPTSRHFMDTRNGLGFRPLAEYMQFQRFNNHPGFDNAEISSSSPCGVYVFFN